MNKGKVIVGAIMVGSALAFFSYLIGGSAGWNIFAFIVGALGWISNQAESIAKTNLEYNQKKQTELLEQIVKQNKEETTKNNKL